MKFSSLVAPFCDPELEILGHTTQNPSNHETYSLYPENSFPHLSPDSLFFVTSCKAEKKKSSKSGIEVVHRKPIAELSAAIKDAGHKHKLGGAVWDKPPYRRMGGIRGALVLFGQRYLRKNGEPLVVTRRDDFLNWFGC